MTTYATKTKENRVRTKIDELSEAGRPGEWEIIRLKKDAEEIKNAIDVAAGFSLLGLIACIEGDSEEMHRCHKNALHYSPENSLFLADYASSLTNSGLYESAYELFIKSYENDPADTEILDRVILLSILTMDKDGFDKFAEDWRRLTKKKHKYLGKPLFFSPKSNYDVNEFVHSHKEIETVFSKCGNELIEIFGVPLNVTFDLVPEGDREILHGSIVSTDPVEEGMEKFDRFLDWYIDEDVDLITDRFIFNIIFP